MDSNKIGSQKIPLPGSNKKHLKGSREIGSSDSNERIEVSIIIRPSSSSAKNNADEIGSLPPKNRVHLTREEFASSHGASQDDIEKVEDFATQNGLKVENTSAARRTVVLSGTITQFEKAFGVKLKRFQHPKLMGVNYRGREGAIYVPASLSNIIQAVLGLDDRPQVVPYFRLVTSGASNITSYSPSQIAGMYDFPSTLDGSGECIGIIEFGGGYSQSDLSTFFKGAKMSTPKIITVSIDGGTNSPTGDPNGPDGEVMLDIEVVGSIASGAQIAMYFAPNNDRGFVDAITTAANDAKNAPSVISISWGQAEIEWTSQAIQAVNQAIQDAAAMGVTVTCAAGDGGSEDGVDDGLSHVDFPASSPYALGCGGTTLDSGNGISITKEVVWNGGASGGATGGGISDVFDLPTWQSNSNVPPSTNPGGRVGRGVPDVSGDADPKTGYSVIVDGEAEPIGGTSAVAPLWAGLIALINQKLGHSIGFINPILYQLDSQSKVDFHDVTVGNNGAYSAGPGWDPCTGLGTPDGSKIVNDIVSSE